MSSLVQLLTSIGLSEKEATIYIANLRIGTSPASRISKNSGLNRCTVYTILQTLENKKLVHKFERNKVRYFTAADPEDLLKYIEAKRYNLQNHKEILNSNISRLKAIKNPKHITPHAQSYTGHNEIQKIYHRILDEPALSIICVPVKKNHDPFVHFSLKYLETHSVLRIIRKKNMKTMKYLIRNRDEFKKLPPSIPIELITPSYVFLTSVSDAFGVEISNATIIQQKHEQFNILWNV